MAEPLKDRGEKMEEHCIKEAHLESLRMKDLADIGNLRRVPRGQNEQNESFAVRSNKLESEVRALELELREVKAKEKYFETQALTSQEELQKMHSQWKNCSSWLEVMVPEVCGLKSEDNRLHHEAGDSKCKEPDIRERYKTFMEERKGHMPFGKGENLNTNTHVDQLKHQIENKRSENELLWAQIDELCNKQDEKTEELSDNLVNLQTSRRRDQEESEKLRKVLRDLQVKKDLLKEQNESLTARSNKLESDVRALERELKDTRAKEKYYETQALTAQEELQKMNDQWQNCSSWLEVMVPEMAALFDEERKTHQEAKDSKCKDLNLKARYKSLSKARRAPVPAVSEENRSTNTQVALLKYQVEKKQTENELLWAQIAELHKKQDEKAEEISNKVAHFDSLKKRVQAEVENLRKALHQLQTREGFLKEQNEGLTACCTKLESQLKALELKLKEVHAKEKISESHAITAQEELRRTQERWRELDVKMNAEVTQLRSQVEQKQRENENLRAQVGELREHQEDLSYKEAHLESQRKRKHAENEKLRKALHDLQVKEDFLNEHNRNLSARSSSLELEVKALVLELKEVRAKEKLHDNRAKTTQEEFEKLQENWKELNLQMSSEVTRLKSQNEKKWRENENLFAKIATLVEKQDELTRKETRLESLWRREQEEAEKLRQALCDLQMKNDSLMEQNQNLTVKLAKLGGVKEKEKQEVQNQKKSLQELKSQLIATEMVIWNKDDLITKQKNRIAHQRQIEDDLKALIGNLKDIIDDLRVQLERKEEEDVIREGCKNTLLQRRSGCFK